MSFRYVLTGFALSVALAACGGGDEEGDHGVDEVTTPTISLTPYAPNDDLGALPGSISDSSTSASTLCGVGVGNARLAGVVGSVHDGDTITVGDTAVRLDSIDAPELGQTYGQESKQKLVQKLLGKTVTVAYAKKDRYGRVVGAVFTSDCEQINLDQVRTGAAWYYEAYRCEVSAATRNAFALAQDHAQEANLGLWQYPAIAPWVYRNGVEPTIPACPSSEPSWTTSSTNPDSGAHPVTPAPQPSPAPVVTPPPASTCAPVWVNGYTRRDGTRVRGYWRKRPGC